MKKIKNEIKNGIKITTLIKHYPNVRPAFFYEIKSGRRWKDIKKKKRKNERNNWRRIKRITSSR